MAETTKKSVVLFLVIGMLITGSINTVSKKLGYDTCSLGLNNIKATADAESCPLANERKFIKPWTQTLVMFVGEATCLLLYAYQKYKTKRRERGEVWRTPLLPKGGTPLPATPAGVAPRSLTWNDAFVCLLPALCDLGGTTLSGIGLVFTSPSVYQMLRGSIIIFTAIFSVIFLKRKLKTFHRIGVFITVVGITLVGLASFLESGKKKKDKSGSLVMVGNLLVVLSQVLSACQMVVEEKFLKKRKLPPAFVVGCEGSWGALLMVAIVLPVVYFLPGLDGGGVHENAIDAAVLVSHSLQLGILVGMYFLSIAFYNVFGLSVAKNMSSVHRTLIDACRTTFVWGADLIIFYATADGTGHSAYGEDWEGRSSLVQLAGFIIMSFGTMVYYEVIPLPKCISCTKSKETNGPDDDGNDAP